MKRCSLHSNALCVHTPLFRYGKTVRIASSIPDPSQSSPLNLARPEKALVAWMLYFSILFGSLLCAMGHGQMAGLRLSGLDDAAWCAADSSGAFKGDQDITDPVPSTGADCVITSLFCASLLAAFFGLLALLAGESRTPLPRQPPPRLPKHRWPLVNPRASPAPLPVL
jgi:hypothetical protein